ncbi:beta-ketoacyl synthase N-terminal-like domain-containing protein [Halopenitus salinus]|uniref:Beta-ketoacyl synthase N-terminal-like domain-containing protein n=1 Tax=Halopenitus salinus TaxID=1198295 RepID=A0ABD5URL8_9EURY
MGSARIAGVGLTRFGSHPERTGRELFARAAAEAMEDAGVPRSDVETLNYGNYMGSIAENQGHQAPLMAEAAGVSCPATRYEEACASAGVAVREAVRAVRAGDVDVAIAGGMERMSHLETDAVTAGLATAADDLLEVKAGMTFPGAYALMARSYFETYGGTRRDLAHIASKNHENAVPNEYAQYRNRVSVDRALESPTVASPLHLFDACPITDGASAVVFVSERYADSEDVDAPVAVTGSGQGTDRMVLADREFLARTPAATRAAESAYGEAGIGPEDVDVAEVHDCFTIAEVLAIESLGFAPNGEGIAAAREGLTTADGDLPVNLSGGLKAKGHPVGATGGSQIVEVTRLLRGDHPNAEHVPDADVGVAHNAGGSVASAVVHVLEVVA